MIKKLLLATFGGAMIATPALAESSYMEGYKEGMNVGVFIAYCQSYKARDFEDPGFARYMTFESFKELDEGNKQWARDSHPTCAPY